MARLRLSAPAKVDIQDILARSLEGWGADGRRRYAALLAAALRSLAADPAGPTTRARDEVLHGVRSFHVRHMPSKRGVRQPVHVVFYGSVPPDVVEVVRVLHERMDPTRPLDEPSTARKPPRSRGR